jgi:hypothetical protein
MATLTVGRGQQYATVSQAIAASRDGDVLQVQAGTYTNDFATITTDITLKAVGGMAHMKATTPPGNGKAIFVTRGDITIEGFEFSGVKVRDGNGAGIRHEDGDLTIRGSHFHHNQDGILTIGRNAEATLTIHDSEFNNNGIGDGRTHNLYVGKIGRLEVDNSYFHTVPVGHLLKSRAEETVITNSRFFDHGSSASYEIDLPNGGDAVLRGNVIQQGPNSQNANIVAFGAEGNLHPGSSIEMTDNVVINQRAAGGTMLWNKAGAPATRLRRCGGPGAVRAGQCLRHRVPACGAAARHLLPLGGWRSPDAAAGAESGSAAAPAAGAAAFAESGAAAIGARGERCGAHLGHGRRRPAARRRRTEPADRARGRRHPRWRPGR